MKIPYKIQETKIIQYQDVSLRESLPFSLYGNYSCTSELDLDPYKTRNKMRVVPRIENLDID